MFKFHLCKCIHVSAARIYVCDVCHGSEDHLKDYPQNPVSTNMFDFEVSPRLSTFYRDMQLP